ncbi:hypothetical protein [Croceitalea vernalis]|uniref:DUF4178 domain-containing protein n=1 Tax=Croceitalea vernalis TaxID=3075599 RepID=A0ABU3BLB3_9FLAO|nr:hypothetical protein [Croceitalea sp. P007]MDT0622958.1 hypothetical protein [Croceitalea sp. P007]
MRNLLFSAFLLVLILLIDIIWRSKKSIGLKVLKGFGILIGFLTIGLYSITDDSFGASSPVNVHTENRTDENLKVYTIAFWQDNWNGSFVTFDKELKPKEQSDFWFENDGTDEFWVVGKNENEDIKFLEVVSENRGEFFFAITGIKKIEPNQIQIAKDLTFKKDKSVAMEKYAVWSIFGLMGLLFLSMLYDLKNWWQQWL